MKWWKKIPWFKAVGGAILFVSWISQNYFIAERKDELAYLNLAQTLISIEEGHFIEWLAVYLVEQRKESPNPQILKDAALKAAQHQLNIITWATARVTDPGTHNQLLKEKKELQVKLIKSHEQNDQSEIISWLSGTIDAANKEGPILKEAADVRYSVARTQNEIWNKRFLAFYIIGSVLLGIGVVRKWLNQDKTA